MHLSYSFHHSIILSALLPIHTRILFNMLQEAYRVKAKEKPILVSKNGQIDFLALLSTAIDSTTTVATVTTTEQSETTGTEVVIHANDIQLGKIFPDQSTVPTEFDNFTTSEIFENNTIQSDYINTTDEQVTFDIQTSTTILWSNDDDNNTINSTESIPMTTTEPVDLTSSNETDSSNPTTTLPINTTMDNAHSQLLYKLCQQIFSQFLSNGSSSLAHHNNTINALLSWFNKHLNSSATTTAAALPSFVLNEKSSSAPLQRINMDDVLHQIDNYSDDENAHR